MRVDAHIYDSSPRVVYVVSRVAHEPILEESDVNVRCAIRLAQTRAVERRILYISSLR